MELSIDNIFSLIEDIEKARAPKVNSATSYGTLKSFKEIRCHVCHKKLKKNRAKWLYEMAFCSKKHKKSYKKVLGETRKSLAFKYL